MGRTRRTLVAVGRAAVDHLAGVEAQHVAFGDALLGQALDGLEQLVLVRRHQRDRLAAASGTAGTTDAVDVVFLDVGQLVVDHVGQLVDVQAAGGDVGGDQDAHVVGLEVGQRLGARVLALVAVDRGSRQAVLGQVLGQAVGAVFGAGEHQHLFPGAEGDQMRQQNALLYRRHAEHALLDTLDGGVRRRDLDAFRVVQQLVGEVGDVFREGRREQQVLALGRQLGEDLLHVVDEAHVEHAVGFVEDQDFHVGQVDAALADEVEQAAGARDQNVDTLGYGLDLWVHADAAEDAGAFQRQIAGVDLEAFMHLGSQLAGRGQHQDAGLAWAVAMLAVGVAGREQAFQDRQGETARLAGAGLGGNHQVAALQYGGNGPLLDGRGVRVAGSFYCIGQGLGETEGNKGHAGFLYVGNLPTLGRVIVARGECLAGRPAAPRPRFTGSALAGNLGGEPGAVTSAWKLEVVPDCQAGFSLVQSIEMQTRCAASQQAFAHLGDHVLTERLDAANVVAVGFQLLADPARNFRTTGIREARQLGVVGDRHDPRHYRDIHTELFHTFDEVEVAVGVEEVLGDGTVCAGLGLAHEVSQIILEVAGLRVNFRISGNFDMEMITGFVADELYQFVGITQLATGHAHARRQVATQRDDATDAGFLVLGEEGAQFFAGVADAGQVRCGGNLHLAIQLQHGGQGAVAGGATGAVGAGEEVRLVAGQLACSGQEFFMPGFGLRGEEFEAVAAFLGHREGSLLSFKPQAASHKSESDPLAACSLQLAAAVSNDRCPA
ncbi:hypothetical protein D9M71_183960 [compost metagenome]